MASLILKKIDSPTHGFKTLIESHLKRIAPTLGYATAQNNNHVTSEAAALYLGGGFLKLHGVKRGAYWYNIGKKQLEKSVQKLVSKDGTFSQYSVNYHRVFLDTVCMVEILNRYFNFSEFSKTYYKKLIAATHWLYSFTNPFNGEAPNIGANDGAKLLPIGNLEYLDYRATVQLSSILFSGKRAFSAEGEWNEPCTILNVALPKEQRSEPYSKIFADGGFVFMKRKAAFVAMRYPHFKFRPSQADAMHVDLWVKGENLLRDAGTYSYNTEPQWMRYFSGTKSHNTVEFDGRDQMPRIGRFLFGSWLRLKHHSNLEEDNEAVKFSASYEDYKKARHSRTVELKDNFLRVTDECVGFEKKAILRWRLRPGNWRIANNTLYNEKESIKVISNVEIEDFRLVLGWESRYYGKKAKLPVLEVEICNPGAFITEYSW